MSSTNNSKTRSKSKSPKLSKTRRQKQITDYYQKKSSRTPTFKEIYENRHILPKAWIELVEFYSGIVLNHGNYVLLFYAEYLDDIYDDENMLDITRPLTPKYFHKLAEKHKTWIQSQPYDYESYFDYSYRSFEKLQELPANYVQFKKSKQMAMTFIKQNKTPHDVGRYIDSFLERSNFGF